MTSGILVPSDLRQVMLALVTWMAATVAVATGVCDAPAVVDVERKTAEGGRRASIAWNGIEYGIVWMEGDPRGLAGTELFFARVDSLGIVLGSPVRVVDDPWPTRPVLVWDGTGYGLVWQDGLRYMADVGYRLSFARLDAQGQVINPGIRIVDVFPNRLLSDAELVWTGTEYAVAWDSNEDEVIRLARIDAIGEVIGKTAVYEGGGTHILESLAWNGAEYSVVFRRESTYRFLRIEATGNPIPGSLKTVGAGPPHEFVIPTLNRFAAHVWQGSGYGLVMRFCVTSNGPAIWCSLLSTPKGT